MSRIVQIRRSDICDRRQHRADENIEPAQFWIARRVRKQRHLLAGRQDGLPVRRKDRAVVLDLRADQDDASAAVERRRRGRDDRPLFDDHLAVLRGLRCRVRLEGVGRPRRPARLTIGREGELRVGVAEQCAGIEQRLVDRQGRRDQGADIHLGAAAKDDAVAVDHIDLSIRLDIAEDLARRGARRHPVERHPGGISLLVEIQRSARTDVEACPVEDRLRRGLLDIDDGLVARNGLRRRAGAYPGGDRIGHACTGETGIRLQSPDREAVWHVDRANQRGLSRLRRPARRRLQRLDGLHRLRSPNERAPALLRNHRSLLLDSHLLRCGVGDWRAGLANATCFGGG